MTSEKEEVDTMAAVAGAKARENFTAAMVVGMATREAPGEGAAEVVEVMDPVPEGVLEGVGELEGVRVLLEVVLL